MSPRPALAVILVLLTLLPVQPPAGAVLANPGLDFDILTGQDTYEANVSDPSVPSITFVATIKNNGTLPIVNVRLTASINLGGTATISPSDTGLIPYNGQTTAVVSATMPSNTAISLVASLRIDGVCTGTGPVGQVSHFRQVVLTIRQWHSIKLQNVSLSTDRPVEREIMQVSSRVKNIGNGPAFLNVSAFLDGRPIMARADGAPINPNQTVRVDAGKFVILSASWKAIYGHHSIVLKAEDVGPPEANLSESFSRDSRVVAFFVNFNTRDWIPYFLVAGLIFAVIGAVAFRYRKRLARRYPRVGRAFRIKLPPSAEKLQRAVGAQVKRARGAAARAGQRPLPKYISGRVRSDIDKLRSRTIPKGPPPTDEELEKLKPAEGRGLR